MSFKTTYLVTGAAGMIAYSVIKELFSFYGDDIRIIGVDSCLSSTEQYTEQRIDNLKNYNNFIYIQADLNSFPFCIDLLKTYQPEVVVHLAAKVNVSRSYYEPKSYLDNNLNSFNNILEAIRLCCPKIPVIYASSSSVYGKTSPEEQNFNKETDKLQPISPYGLSKLINEQVAQTYADSYGMNVIGLRFFTVYGQFLRKDMFIYKVIDSILHHKEIKLFNNGNMKRDFTYAQDVAQCIVQLSSLARKKLIMHHNLYNIGKGSYNSLAEVVSLCENLLGKKAYIEYDYEIPTYDPIYTLCDNRKLLSLIHPFEFTSLEKGLIKVLEKYQSLS